MSSWGHSVITALLPSHLRALGGNALLQETNIFILPSRQASHPSCEAGSGQPPPPLSFLTLSITCQGLAGASLLAIMKIFLSSQVLQLGRIHGITSCRGHPRRGPHAGLGTAAGDPGIELSSSAIQGCGTPWIHWGDQ
ncbi:hypothetical protein H1C71_029124 [Ictidomys tridecemlineatus]|nr:hypothetical protein H1C71_029124 [Ictidomys tridecemlineatus]